MKSHKVNTYRIIIYYLLLCTLSYDYRILLSLVLPTTIITFTGLCCCGALLIIKRMYYLLLLPTYPLDELQNCKVDEKPFIVDDDSISPPGLNPLRSRDVTVMTLDLSS